MPKTLTIPNAEQLAAIQIFADKYGKNWKSKLSELWMTGRDTNEPSGHLLRQVRNNCLPWFNSAKNTVKPTAKQTCLKK